MIIAALIIAGAILSVVAVIVFVLHLAHAPEGFEDETGFHPLKKPDTARNRHYCAKCEPTLSAGAAKPFKAHIPAA